MNLKFKEIEEKEVWENFFDFVQEKTFLNSWNWGEFQKMMGNKIWRLGIFEGDSKLLGLALVIKISAKRGSFLFLPHSPSIIDDSKKFEVLKALLEKLKEIAKEEKITFLRIAPIWERNNENENIFKNLGFKKAPLHIHPEMTFELDIKNSNEEILKNMRKTTRYLIRQGLKNKEIEIERENSLLGIEKFNVLYQETAKRQKFVPFSFEYLKNEFLVFSKDDQISILLGKYKNEISAGGIFIFWQNIAFYHHGASLQKYPKVPVSYLLIWRAIEEAKKRGCEKFNFWGGVKIEERNLKHPWYGLSLFKKGFGAVEKEYLETKDFPLKKFYWLNFLVETIRKWKRYGFG